MTTPKADDATIAHALAGLPGWQRSGDELCCTYRFGAFAVAVEFTARIAAVAEQRQHHPEWTVRHREVEVATTTHDAGGLTGRDLELAADIAAVATDLAGETAHSKHDRAERAKKRS
ncbi:MAG: 4a-hydroxytetrahydrobiopterin dehydratase [Planctomycetes bacterium]|nr:4a-hydroxytetrahydrobiopterin dehydratase [Planctomycetota bacterium]